MNSQRQVITIGLVVASLLTGGLLISGCGPGQSLEPKPMPTPLPPTPASTAEPPSAQLPSTSTPTPTTAVSSTTGIVRGVLTDKSNGQPVSNVRVVLGIVEYDDNGQLSRYKFSAEQGMMLRSAYTDIAGVFRIETPPGIYVLVSPGGSPFDKIAREASGTVIIVNVESGQTVDVGTIQMSQP